MKELMKRIGIAIFIVIIVILFDYLILNNTNRVVNSMNNKLEKIDEDIILGNNLNLSKEIEDVYNNWENKQKFMSCYLEHDEIEKIFDKICLIKKEIEMENTDDARENITELIFLFNHINSKQNLNLENFF